MFSTDRYEMPYDEDKYPQSTGRRRFVKGIVGSGVLVGLGAATASAVELTTSPSGVGGGVTPYYGNIVLDGPAPRGMPQVPIEIDDEGFISGLWPEAETEMREGQEVTVAATELGGITYSTEWFQYCGVETNPGLAPEADLDNYFRYIESPPYAWQEEAVTAGDRVNVADFQDYESWGNEIGKSGVGKPAVVTWRSEEAESGAEIPVQLIRSPTVENMADGDQWLEASTQEGFIANLNKCTHFCCVPGYKTTAQAAGFDAANEIYCPCHQSVYAPFEIEEQTFVAFPRPIEDETDGAATPSGEDGGTSPSGEDGGTSPSGEDGGTSPSGEWRRRD